MQTGVTGTQGCGHCTIHRYHGAILPSVALGFYIGRVWERLCGPSWNPVASLSGNTKPGRINILFKADRFPRFLKGKAKQRESIAFIGKSHLLHSCHSRMQSVAEGRWYCCLCNDLAQVQYHGNRFHVRVRVGYETSPCMYSRNSEI